MGLLDRLLKIVPPSLTRFFFANSGSEAVDNAIKVARAHTKRQNIICFEVSTHPTLPAQESHEHHLLGTEQTEPPGHAPLSSYMTCFTE